MTKNKLEKKRKLKGVVASDKMQKTAVVKVQRLIKHPKYKMYFKVTNSVKAHNPENQYHTGDKVYIEETRPMSKDKRWIIIGKV